MRVFLFLLLIVIASACSSSADGLTFDAATSTGPTVVSDLRTQTSVSASAGVGAISSVWIATTSIPIGTPVEEVMESLELREVDAATVPDNAHPNPAAALDTVANADIDAGTVVTSDHLVTHYCFNDSRTCDVYMPPELLPGNVMAYVVTEPIPAGTPVRLGGPSVDYRELPADSVPIEAIFNTFETNGLVIAADLEPQAFLTLDVLVTPECFVDPTTCPAE